MNDIEQVAAKWGVPIAIALLAVAVRILFSADRATLAGVIRGVLVGVFVGTVTNLYLLDYPDLGEGTRGALVGMAAVLAEDIIVSLLKLGKKFRENPDSLLDILRKRP